METKSIPEKIYGNSGMVHLVEINQAPPPYSMLQYSAFWESSNIEECTKKMSLILTNNIEKEGGGRGWWEGGGVGW